MGSQRAPESRLRSMSVRLAFLAFVLVLTGCAQPSQQYINADTYGMYFALPREWSAVPSEQLSKAQQGWQDDAGQVFIDTVRWQAAWGPAGITPDNLFAAVPSEQPTAFAFVRDLLNVETRQIGDDIEMALQDIVLPTSSLLAAGVEVESTQWRQNGFLGIQQTATYPAGGGRSTVDVVSMLSPNRSRLYVLVLRCSETCFAENRTKFDDVIDSLKFEETSGQ